MKVCDAQYNKHSKLKKERVLNKERKGFKPSKNSSSFLKFQNVLDFSFKKLHE